MIDIRHHWIMQMQMQMQTIMHIQKKNESSNQSRYYFYCSTVQRKLCSVLVDWLTRLTHSHSDTFRHLKMTIMRQIPILVYKVPYCRSNGTTVVFYLDLKKNSSNKAIMNCCHCYNDEWKKLKQTRRRLMKWNLFYSDDPYMATNNDNNLFA